MNNIDTFVPKSRHPCGTSGPWTVDRFDITKDAAAMFNLQAFMRGIGERQVKPERITRFFHEKRGCIMSDTPSERRDHLRPAMDCHGDVLIAGLGMGLIADALLTRHERAPERPPVDSVTIVEIDGDVIDLTGNWLTSKHGNRVEIVHADVMDWRPGVSFDSAWFDIWDDICSGNLAEMKTLRERFWQADYIGCWAERECKRERSRWAMIEKAERRLRAVDEAGE